MAKIFVDDVTFIDDSRFLVASEDGDNGLEKDKGGDGCRGTKIIKRTWNYLTISYFILTEKMMRKIKEIKSSFIMRNFLRSCAK